MRISGQARGWAASMTVALTAWAAVGAPGLRQEPAKPQAPKPGTANTAKAQNSPGTKPAGRVATGAIAEAFERKVRPLLIDKCVPCHNKDTQLGGVRLDQAFDAKIAKKVLEAVNYDGHVKMPPSGKLPEPERRVVAEWIGAGAPWPAAAKTAAPADDFNARIKRHWAFQPLRRPAIPDVSDPTWNWNPIDSFVRAKLDAAGLKPARPADRRTLLRRVTYDLTGLAPTPEDVESFVNDRAPDAWEKVVDRLLASPQYGEKWGRHWLDLVRFAETNSYERDNPKPHPWRFRDYVIRSFNADKPYDRFVQEQLAGDELPDGGADGLIATGFYRLGIWDDEPSDAELARYDGLDDIVATVGQTMLGLTLDCARCHTHKIDPIPQADYYKFLAFFQGINHFRNGGPTDEKAIFPTREDRLKYEAEVARLDKERNDGKARHDALRAEYLKKRDAFALAGGDVSNVRWRRYAGNFDKLPNFTALTAAETGVFPQPLIDIAPLRGKGSVAAVFTVDVNMNQAGKAAFFLDSDDGSRLRVDGREVINHDGSHGEGSEKKVELDLSAGTHTVEVEYYQGDPASPMGLSVAWNRPGSPRRPLTVASSTSPLGLPVQFAHDKKEVLGEGDSAEFDRLAKLLDPATTPQAPVDKALVVTEGGRNPQETFILQRGVPANKGEKVEPGYPLCAGGGTAVFSGTVPDPSTSGRRSVLANWMVSPDNALTPRVIVNRIWQYHFGRGIVRSSNNFGVAGDRPTHPELLDWLATEFVRQGWSFKKMHRLILTSNAWKLSSVASAESRKKDPQNDLLQHFDMRRLQAEEIRDSILQASGQLNLAQFGPSVYPDIDKAVMQGQSIPGKDWHPERNKPEEKNRRSIYIFVKRSLLFPLLEAFDIAETDRTTPMRYASTQPTQALTMLNSTLMLQSAKAMAERVQRDAGMDPDAFVARALQLVVQRPPTAAEVVKLRSLVIRLELRGAGDDQVRTYVCLAALNLNEFLYLD